MRGFILPYAKFVPAVGSQMDMCRLPRQVPAINLRHGHTSPFRPLLVRCNLSQNTESVESANGQMFILGMGFVGQFFAADLKSKGWVVSGSCTSIEKKTKLEEMGFHAYVFDANDPQPEILDIVKNHTHLLVSIPPVKGLGDPMVCHKEFVKRRLKDGKIQWLTYLSSTSVYGEYGGAWVDEDYPIRPTSETARARLVAEEEWLCLGRDLGIPAQIFRLGGIYGPGRSAIDTIIKQEPLSKDQKMRLCKQYTSRVHVADICQALNASILKRSPWEVYNIVDDDPAPRMEVFLWAQNLVERKFPGHVKQPTISAEREESLISRGDKRVSNARMKKELGVKLFHPTYRSGLQSIIDHMDNPYLQNSPDMKHLLQSSFSYCVKEKKPCIGWVDKYFKDCLCNLKDELSFGFGIISLVCWGVAEIPQIISNFRSKSSHGISLLFLLTWIAGDTLNLVGCLLEPATLPTQYYTALLYTTSTVILVLQCLYFDYFYKCWKNNEKEPIQGVEEVEKPLKPPKPDATTIPIPSGTAEVTPQKDVYHYASARSLAGSTPPPFRSYLGPVRSGPSSVGIKNELSSDDEGNQSRSEKYVSQSKPIPRYVGYSAFLATSINMPPGTQALMQVYVGLTGRKLLQEHGTENVYGQWLGWIMAAIYMSGRLPQIWLNIKRGSVQGLNPLMFIFALLANAAYVASILVRSIAWEKIKANLPWLLDAFGCVVLDTFIILQYVYYGYFCRKTCSNEEEDYGDYIEANKG